MRIASPFAVDLPPNWKVHDRPRGPPARTGCVHHDYLAALNPPAPGPPSGAGVPPLTSSCAGRGPWEPHASVWQAPVERNPLEARGWDGLVLWYTLAMIPPGDDPTGWESAALSYL